MSTAFMGFFGCMCHAARATSVASSFLEHYTEIVEELKLPFGEFSMQKQDVLTLLDHLPDPLDPEQLMHELCT